jgi:hypothetical protein
MSSLRLPSDSVERAEPNQGRLPMPAFNPFDTFPLTLAFNMFRRRPRQLVCAVPQDCVVPAFVTAERWAFEGVVNDTAPVPAGFDQSAATLGVKYNGFYLFQVVD